MQRADLRQSVSMPQKTLSRSRLLLACTIAALAAGGALAQQPVQPLPKVGGCPLGYYSSGGYCVPSSGGNTRGAIEKSGAGCPLGFYSSGNYCLSSPSNERDAPMNYRGAEAHATSRNTPRYRQGISCQR